MPQSTIVRLYIGLAIFMQHDYCHRVNYPDTLVLLPDAYGKQSLDIVLSGTQMVDGFALAGRGVGSDR